MFVKFKTVDFVFGLSVNQARHTGVLFSPPCQNFISGVLRAVNQPLSGAQISGGGW